MANTYNTKNYFAHGGEQLVIGGKLTFLEGAEVENFPGGNTNSSEAPYVADSEATTVAALKTDFNSLLAALRTAGILSTTAPETTETPSEGEGGGG
jgi:Head fiber protein.